MGKLKTISCENNAGNVLAMKTASIKDLLKWVKSYECIYGSDTSKASCDCTHEVAHLADIKCVADNVWSCTNKKNRSITFTIKNKKKCAKLVAKTKCAITVT